MYHQFFGFESKPFSLAACPRHLYLSKSHKAALTALKYGLVDRSGIILMTGEIGAGKTTLMRYLLDKVRNLNGLSVIEIPNTTLLEDTLVKASLQELGVELEGNEPSATQVKILNEYLLRQHKLDKRVLLVLDEAQSLPDRALQEIRMLSNMQCGDDILLQILLIGQSELRARIMERQKTYLAQRIAVSCHLNPLEPQETRAYIKHRLAEAGHASPDTLFSPDAVKLIHETSGGIPRVINIICNLALIYAFADETTTISVQTIREVIKDRQESGLPLDEHTRDSQTVSGALSEHQNDLASLQKRVAQLESHIQKISRILSEFRAAGALKRRPDGN